MNNFKIKKTEGAKKIFAPLFTSLIAVLLLSACEEVKELRVYQEPVPKPQAAMNMPSLPNQGAKPTYDFSAPKTWVETRGDAMRILSLGTPAGNDVAVTFLGGQAGNLESNLTRWARQIELTLDAKSMQTLIADAIPLERKDGVKGKIFDFSPYISDEKKSNSIWATIFDEPNGVLFVKVMGPKSAIQTDLNDLKSFAQSLTHKEL